MGSTRRILSSLAVFALSAAALATTPAGCGNGASTPDSGACSSGQTMCGSKCTNVKEDPENCGACGTVCPAFSICDLGTCTGVVDGGGGHDAAAEAAADASSDASSDAASVDAAADAAADASSDAASDAADASPE